MKPGVMSFKEEIELFFDSLAKLIKSFFALLGKCTTMNLYNKLSDIMAYLA